MNDETDEAFQVAVREQSAAVQDVYGDLTVDELAVGAALCFGLVAAESRLRATRLVLPDDEPYQTAVTRFISESLTAFRRTVERRRELEVAGAGGGD